MKILHASDLHLGLKFKSSSYDKKQREIRRREMWDCLKNFLNKCEDEHADAVIFTGDMLECEYISRDEFNYFFSLLGSSRNVKFFMVLGNHDRLSFEDLYYGLELPDNVYMFKNDVLECIEDERLNLRVYGASWIFSSYDEQFDLKEVRLDDAYINILALHSDVYSKGYMYVPLEVLKNSDYNYVALGHIHKPIIDGKVSYAGALEAHSFADTVGGYNEIIAEGDYLSVQYKPYGLRNYISSEIDVTGCDFVRIVDMLNDVISTESDNYRIYLIGDLRSDIEVDSLKLQVQNKAFFVEIVDKTVKSNIDITDMLLYGDIKRKLEELDLCFEQRQRVEKLILGALTEGVNADK